MLYEADQLCVIEFLIKGKSYKKKIRILKKDTSQVSFIISI